MERLKQDIARLMALPPKARATLLAVAAFVGVVAIAADLWPLLILGIGVLVYVRYLKRARNDAGLSAADTAAARTAVLTAARKALSAADEETRRQGLRLAEATAAELDAKRAKFRQTAEAPPAAPTPQLTPATPHRGAIVEDGGSFWRWRRRSSGGIVD